MLTRDVPRRQEGTWGPTEVKNFGKDLKDSTVYAALLMAVAPADQKPRTLLADVRSEINPTRRAQLIVDAAESLGVTQFKILPGDIVKGNEKLNMGFMAAIFNHLPGLDPKSTNDDAAKLLAENMMDDAEASREERAFRMWINSLGLDQHVNDLATEMRDGLLLLHIMDQVKPGVVDWTKVNLKPKNVYNKIANCNYAITLGSDKKKFGFSLVGIQGKDISDGNLKLILALTWQLMRYHVIQFLSNLSGMSKGGGNLLSETDVVNWANGMVADAQVAPIQTLKDGSIGSGVFLLELIKVSHRVQSRSPPSRAPLPRPPSSRMLRIACDHTPCFTSLEIHPSPLHASPRSRSTPPPACVVPSRPSSRAQSMPPRSLPARASKIRFSTPSTRSAARARWAACPV